MEPALSCVVVFSLEGGERVRAVYDEEGMAKLVIVVVEDLD